MQNPAKDNGPGQSGTSGKQARTVARITGPNALQNELLKCYLEKETGLLCSVSRDIRPPGGPGAHGPARLLLFDCLNTDMPSLWAALESLPDAAAPGVYVALFNASPDRELTREAMLRKVRGVFYADTPLDVLAKGVSMILKGELWYSREAMASFLMEPKNAPSMPENIARALTAREREILKMIAAGAGNQEISVSLFISLHTVKSHVYNIFKKINVPNRLQAALWAAKYL